MGETYKEIMKRVTVTDEMRQRILETIGGYAYEPKRKVAGTRWILAAACFALLLSAAAALTSISNRLEPDVEMQPSLSLPDFEEVASIHELAEKVGFQVQEMTVLPFDVYEIHYVAFRSGLAEIQYRGESQSVVFRKAAGTEDPSGDYTAYDTVEEMTIDGQAVTLKGSIDGFLLALWQDGAYTCSLRLSDPLAKEEWDEMICGMR